MLGTPRASLQVGLAIGHSGETIHATVATARRAEEIGFDLLGIADVQSSQRETYTSLAAIAAATKRIQIGPLVTNPITRDPTVIASAISTVDELSSGRAYLAIGHGNTSVAQAGLRPATTRSFRASIEVIRRGVKWSSRPVPIIVHSSGPQATKIAEELGDGILLRWGDLDIAQTRELINSVRQSPPVSRALPKRLAVWIYVNAFVGDPKYGREALRYLVASRARRVAPAEVPEDLQAAMDKYRTESIGSYTARPRNSELLSSLKLEDYMFKRFVVNGTAAETCDWLESVRTLDVDAVMFGMSEPHENRLIEALAPALTKRVAQ